MWLTDTQSKSILSYDLISLVANRTPCLEIGVGLTSFGGIFMFLGVVMFFDGGLLALGNILFIAGLTLIIGPQKTFYFFARKNKMRGTACFFGGILLVFFKRPFIGMLIETFGFLNLFGLVLCIAILR
jgi:hypothetical protein